MKNLKPSDDFTDECLSSLPDKTFQDADIKFFREAFCSRCMQSCQHAKGLDTSWAQRMARQEQAINNPLFLNRKDNPKLFDDAQLPFDTITKQEDDWALPPDSKPFRIQLGSPDFEAVLETPLAKSLELTSNTDAKAPEAPPSPVSKPAIIQDTKADVPPAQKPKQAPALNTKVPAGGILLSPPAGTSKPDAPTVAPQGPPSQLLNQPTDPWAMPPDKASGDPRQRRRNVVRASTGEPVQSPSPNTSKKS